MASGLPDYYRSVRPIYGALKTAEVFGVVLPSVVSSLIAKTGKGIILGGFVALDYTSSQKNSGIILAVDGAVIAGYSFAFLYAHKINRSGPTLMYQLGYNDGLYKYSSGISENITFDSSFEVGYYEQHATTPSVYCSMNYALIT